MMVDDKTPTVFVGVFLAISLISNWEEKIKRALIMVSVLRILFLYWTLLRTVVIISKNILGAKS